MYACTPRGLLEGFSSAADGESVGERRKTIPTSRPPVRVERRSMREIVFGRLVSSREEVERSRRRRWVLLALKLVLGLLVVGVESCGLGRGRAMSWAVRLVSGGLRKGSLAVIDSGEYLPIHSGVSKVEVVGVLLEFLSPTS